jgi:limonene-1,2-epoxide hydrolase
MPEESTTPDLVELWGRATEAVVRRDYDAAMSFYATDAVWQARGLGRTFEGRAAVRRFLEEWIGDYEEYGVEILDGENLGNGVLLVGSRHDVRPRGSSRMIQELWAFTVEWDGRVIMRVTAHRDVDEARAAAERLAESRG